MTDVGAVQGVARVEKFCCTLQIPCASGNVQLDTVQDSGENISSNPN